MVDMALEDGTVINDDSHAMFAALPEEIQVNFEIIEVRNVHLYVLIQLYIKIDLTFSNLNSMGHQRLVISLIGSF